MYTHSTIVEGANVSIVKVRRIHTQMAEMANKLSPSCRLLLLIRDGGLLFLSILLLLVLLMLLLYFMLLYPTESIE